MQNREKVREGAECYEAGPLRARTGHVDRRTTAAVRSLVSIGWPILRRPTRYGGCITVRVGSMGEVEVRWLLSQYCQIKVTHSRFCDDEARKTVRSGCLRVVSSWHQTCPLNLEATNTSRGAEANGQNRIAFTWTWQGTRCCPSASRRRASRGRTSPLA